MKVNYLSGVRYLAAAAITLVSAIADDLLIPLASRPLALAVQPNGQFLVADFPVLTRFNEDGTLDTIFDRSAFASVLAVENEGTILAQGVLSISRFNFDGTQLTPPAVRFDNFVLQPDGKLVGLDRTTLRRINPDGSADPTFAASNVPLSILFDSDDGLSLQEDGKIFIGPTRDGSILRFNPDGTPDPTFNPPRILIHPATKIVVQPDRKILLAGEFITVGDTTRIGLARLNADGTIDASFNSNLGRGTVIDSIALQANSKIVVGGRFGSIAGQPATNIARLNADGSFDTGFKPPAPQTDWTVALALQEDGAILASISPNLIRMTNPELATQSFTRDGSTLTWLRGGSCPEVFHTRFQSSFDGVTWTDLGAGTRIAGGWRLENANIPAGARLRVRGYVTGASYYFDHVPGAPAFLSQPSDRTNDVNTTSIFRAFAKGLEPLSFQWFKDGQPVTGALSSTLVLSNVTGGEAGGYQVVVSNSEGSSTGRVARLTVNDPILLTQPSSVWVNTGSTVSLSVNAIGTGLTYQWKKDGQPIPGATSSTLDISNATSVHTGNYQLILTGTYGTIESALAPVHVNHALPDSWNPAYEATSEWLPIQTAAVYNDTLFGGGLFRTLATPSRHHLIKFTAGSVLDPLFDPDPTGAEDPGVSTLSVAPSGQLMVGGTFLTIAGQPQAYLARLHPDGTLDQQFAPTFAGPNAGGFTQVIGIEFLLDGRILIAGDFSGVNGQPRPGVARLFPNGTLDPSFNPDSNSVPALSWAVLVQPDGKIILDGWDLRRINADGSPDKAFTDASLTNNYSNPFLLPNNQLLVNSKAGISRLHPDGSIDLTFPGIGGTLEGVQADGKFIISKLAETIPIVTVTSNSGTISTTTRYQTRYALSRYNPDGSEDPSFSPTFDDFATVKAMEADGSFIVTGWFTNVTGRALPKLARVRNNDAATQSLNITSNTATWLRGGASPEVTRIAFEFSSDGQTWTSLGAGVRIPGGWELTGLQVIGSGKLRARGFAYGSIFESTIEIPAAGLSLAAAHYHADKREITFHISSAAAMPVILEMSTDLKQWTILSTPVVGTQLTLTNLSSPHAFYRLRQSQ